MRKQIHSFGENLDKKMANWSW